jgi:type I restriction enzyme S subunit
MKEYSKYKPSRIEWIGDIPKNWNLVSCRLIVSERNERNEGMKNNNYLSLMANIGVIPYEEKGAIGNKKPENLEKCKIVYKGDFIINSMNYYIGSYGISKYDGICSPVYIVLYANTKIIEPRFAFRVFENPKFQEIAQSFGNGILEHRRAINWDILKNIKIPITSLEEQRDILSFLDKKTEKIDTLISDKEKLIELLKEQRQSIISETVTKGLDKKVQMKPSGIEWIGDIPKTWKTIKLKHITSQPLMYGANEIGENGGQSSIRYIRITDIGDNGNLKTDIFKSLSPEKAKSYLLNIGDILFARSGSVGKTYFHKYGKACFAGYLIKFSPNITMVYPKYVYYITLSNGYKNWIQMNVIQATIKNVSAEKYNNFSIPLPSLKIQHAIVTFLDEKVYKIDKVIENITKQIKKLQEYRKSIISEAVIGKVAI